MGQTPTPGRIVLYQLSEDDATQINRRRKDARDSAVSLDKTGYVVHVGNDVSAGDVYPLVITRTWGDTPESAVNGQVLLDGNDTFWATSVSAGERPRTFAWPVRA